MGTRQRGAVKLRLVKGAARESLSHLDDEALVLRVLEGDQSAEEALLRRHVGELTRVVAHLLGGRQETDDVVQDTLVIALEKLDRLKNPAVFRSWLIQIGVNEVRRVYRRQRVRRFVGLEVRDEGMGLDSLAADGASPEVRAELSLLSEVLRRLSDEHRIAWSLRYVEGYALGEVAESCRCSLATVKRRIAAAQAAVQAAVTMEVDGLE